MALSIIGTPAAAMAASVTLPTHAAGDIIVFYAYAATSTTVPMKPAAGGTVPTWVDIDAASGANSNSSRTAYAVATAANHTSGTWTNADAVAAIVIRGQGGAPIGGHAESGSTTQTEVSAPAVTMIDTDGSSILLHFFGHGYIASWDAAPSGYTRRATALTPGDKGVILNSKDVTTSDGAATNGMSGSAPWGYRGATVEILELSPPGKQPALIVSRQANVRASYF